MLTTLPKFFPFIWVAIVFQFASGFPLWMSKPGRYVQDPVFDIKFSLVIIGVALLVYFQKTIVRDAPDWQVAGKVTSKGWCSPVPPPCAGPSSSSWGA